MLAELVTLVKLVNLPFLAYGLADTYATLGNLTLGELRKAVRIQQRPHAAPRGVPL